jgi:hypothetical protein
MGWVRFGCHKGVNCGGCEENKEMSIKRPRLAILILVIGVVCLVSVAMGTQSLSQSLNGLWCISTVCGCTLSFCVEKKKPNSY